MSLCGYTSFKLNLYALQDVVCCVNVQHDCERASCTGTIEQPVLQERQATALCRSLIQHTDSRSYLLNVFLINNYAYIASVMPTSLELNNVEHVPIEKYGEIHTKAAKYIQEKRGDDVTQLDMTGNQVPSTAENSGGPDTLHRDTLGPPAIPTSSKPIFEKKLTRKKAGKAAQAEGDGSRKRKNTRSQQQPKSSAKKSRRAMQEENQASTSQTPHILSALAAQTRTSSYPPRPDDGLHQLYPSAPPLAGSTYIDPSTMPAYASLSSAWHYTAKSQAHPSLPATLWGGMHSHINRSMPLAVNASSVAMTLQHPVHPQVSGPLLPSVSQQAAVNFMPLPYISPHSISMASPYTNMHRASTQQYICPPDQAYLPTQVGYLPGPLVHYSQIVLLAQLSLPRMSHHGDQH